MAATSFQVSTYHYYDWSSRRAGKTNLILKGAGGESCCVWFVADDSAECDPIGNDATTAAKYAAPQLNVYRDMGDLLALDPPTPGLELTPWQDTEESPTPPASE